MNDLQGDQLFQPKECIILSRDDASVKLVSHNPKGKVWNSIGTVRAGTVSLFPEEALFLVDAHKFELFSESIEIPASDLDKFRLMCLAGGFSSFFIYSCLKKHGFILLRPESHYFPRSRLVSELRAEYSLFKPDSNFKKTSPKGFIGNLIEVRANDSTLEIANILSSSAGSSILAISDNFREICFIEVSVGLPVANKRTSIESNNIPASQPPSQQTIYK